MKNLNYSRQREAIYRYLMSSKEHPTAETVFQAVQKEYPKISLATVYRNLAVLEETGQLQRIPCNDASDHYDADISEHPHFVCKECYAVIDLKMDNLEFLHTLANQGFDGVIEQSQLVFFGKCPQCAAKEENNNNS